MTSEILSKLTDAIAEEIAAKTGPRLIELIKQHKVVDEPDRLLSTKQAAERLDVSQTTIRQLVAMGYLSKVKGMRDIRIRQSTVDAYGKDQPKKKHA